MTENNNNFGRNNLQFTQDEQGIVTLRFDSKVTIAGVGTANAMGKPRNSDLISSSRGAVVVGTCRLNLNVTRL